MNLPIRATFYYPWFPETWGSGTHYEPTIGRYDSSDPHVIAAHIYMMKYARIKAGIASWWGPKKLTDQRFTQLLELGENLGFKWCPYYEPEGYADPTQPQISEHLVYLLSDDRTKSPAWLKVNNKPVLFIYADPADGQELARRWTVANGALGPKAFYLVLKVFDGYRNQPYQPDSWHQYAPANEVQDHRPYSFTVSPGFWHADEPTPRLERDLARFQGDCHAMVASAADWQLVTCFNEYGEGTAIEPTTEWGSDYLDAVRRA